MHGENFLKSGGPARYKKQKGTASFEETIPF
jgi:hypothetical protein